PATTASNCAPLTSTRRRSSLMGCLSAFDTGRTDSGRGLRYSSRRHSHPNEVFMKRFGLLLALCGVVALIERPAAMIPEQVKIDTGLLSGTAGTTQPTVRTFKGIPFAAPPLGENRWKAPQPAAKWEGVRKAVEFAAPCAAGAPPAGRGGGRGPAPGAAGANPPVAPAIVLPPREPARAEDCLYANVWTSAASPNDKRPVMVWIYGGGFTGGSGGLAWYDGEALASKGPVIVTF